MIKAILFDLDDTLFDHSWVAITALKAFHENVCKELEWKGFLSRWSGGRDKYFKPHARGDISEMDQKRCRIRHLLLDDTLEDFRADRLFIQYEKEYEKCYALFPDVLPFLHVINGIELGIITNGSSREQRNKILKTGLSQLFPVSFISEEVGFAKPQSEIFLMACDCLNVNPENCLFVGDNHEIDYLGSQKAGMIPVLIRRNLNYAPNEVRKISDLWDLIRYFRIY